MSFLLEIDKFVMRFCADRNRTLLLLGALVGFGLSVLLVGKLVFSGFSILDDHGILAWLGFNRRVGLSDLWPMLMSTEIGKFGVEAQFRPVMYSLIVLQTWLWGTHPGGFHMMAVIWFGVFLWSVAWVSFRSIGIIAGCAVLFLTVTGQYWGNIFTHSTMVSEQPALLGLGLVIFGFGLTCSWFMDGCRNRNDTGVLLVGLGSLICIGSKGNFIPLLGLDILLVAWAWRMKQIGARTLAISIVLVLLSLVICYGIIVANLGKPTDIYGYNNYIGYRVSMIPHSSLFTKVVLALIAGIAAIVLASRAMARRNNRDACAIVVLGAFLIVAGLFLASQIFFYVGRLPMGQRYDFPALLIYPIFAGAAFFVVMQAGRHNTWIASRFSPLALQVCFALFMLSVAIAYYDRGRFLPVVSAVRISNEHTAMMSRDLTATKALAAQHADWPIIVRPSHPLDYEAVVTFPLWLRYFQISHAASVFVDVAPQDIKSPFDQSLVATMRTQSRDGRPGLYEARNASIEKAQAEGHCYVVEFGNHSTLCTPLPYRPSEYYPVD